MTPLLLMFACQVGSKPSGPLDHDAAVDPCPGGSWAGVDFGDDAVLVTAEADPDGADGSAEHPFPTLTAAIQAGARQLRVDSGVYAETLALTSDHHDLHLAGRCASEVTLDGGFVDATPAIHILAEEGGAFTLSGLRVQGGWHGVLVEGGELRAWDLDASGNYKCGLMVGGEGRPGAATIADSRFAENVDWGSRGDQAYGCGLRSEWGSDVRVERATIEDNQGFGIIASDPAEGEWSLVLEEATVARTVPLSWNDTRAQALLVQYGARVRVVGGAFEDNALLAIGVLGDVDYEGNPAVSYAELDGTRIAGTVPHPTVDNPSWGVGLSSDGGAEVSCVDCVIEANSCRSIFVSGGSTMSLDGGSVTDTDPCGPGTGGEGIWVQRGSGLVATGTRVEGHRGAAIEVLDSQATLAEVRMADVVPDESGLRGAGLHVQDAEVSCDDCVVTGASGGAVQVIGAGSHLRLTGASEITGTRPLADGTNGGGVYVFEDGHFEADGLWIHDNPWVGVHVSGEDAHPDTRATLTDTVIERLTGTDSADPVGVSVGDGGAADLVRTTVREVPGIGIFVYDAAVHVEEVTVSDLTVPGVSGAGSAVTLESGSTLDGSGLTLTGVQLFGLSVARGSTAELSGLTVSGVTPVRSPKSDRDLSACVLASGQSQVTLADVDLSDCGAYALDSGELGTVITVEGGSIGPNDLDAEDDHAYGAVAYDGTLHLADVVVHDVTGSGVWAQGPTGLVTLDGVTVLDGHRSAHYLLAQGVTAAGDGRVEAVDLVVEGVEGPGLTALLGGALVCTGCVVEGNGYAGAQVLDATLQLDGGTVLGPAAVDAEMGGGFGVLATSLETPSTLVLDDVTIEPQPLAGIYLSGIGGYQVTGSRVEGGEDPGGLYGPWANPLVAVAGREAYADLPGPAAWDGATGLYVVDTLLGGAGDAAVFLADASGTLCEVDTSGSAEAVVQQGGAAPPVDCASAALPVTDERYDRLYDYYLPAIGPESPPIVTGE